MVKETTTVRVDKNQLERGRELKKIYNVPLKKIFEKGLLFYENEKEQKYNSLLNEKSKLKDDLIGVEANIDMKRRELLKFDKDLSFNETLTDVFIIFNESKLDIESFFDFKDPNKNKYYHYLIKVSNYYRCDMLKLKQYIKEKKDLENQTTL